MSGNTSGREKRRQEIKKLRERMDKCPRTETQETNTSHCQWWKNQEKEVGTQKKNEKKS